MRILKNLTLALVAMVYFTSCTQTDVNPANSTTPNQQKTVSPPVEGLYVNYGEAFEITKDLMAYLPNHEVVDFFDVLEDSRCPEGTQCTWAGQAKVRFVFRGQHVNLILTPGRSDLATAELNGYAIQLLDLSAKEKGAYKAKVIVHRAYNRRSVPRRELNANYDQAFEITQDVNAVFSDDKRVDFIKVLEDSRCPEGVQCITAGKAKVRLSFNSQTVDLTLAPGKIAGAEFDGYAIRLLELSAKEKGAYKAKIVVYRAVN